MIHVGIDELVVKDFLKFYNNIRVDCVLCLELYT